MDAGYLFWTTLDISTDPFLQLETTVLLSYTFHGNSNIGDNMKNIQQYQRWR